ncbi:hypothetical protein [Actinophytocola sediminis]
MTTEVIVALISSPVLVAVLGLLRETRKTRRDNETEHRVVATKVDELAKDTTEMRADVKDIRTEQNRQGQQLATLQARFDDHLLERTRGR